MRPLALAATLLLVVLIGYVDYITGPDIGLSLFYLPPIVAMAWYHGRAASLAVAMTAAACWFMADFAVRVSLGLSLWNGLTRLVIFVSQGLLIAVLREDRLRQAFLARTDPTTGLANTRAFREILERSIGSGSLCVVSIDLDHFKQVNDGYGHQAGDEVLERTGRALRESVRATDVTARIGGDEFALLLPDVDSAVAEVVAARILEKMQAIASGVPSAGFGASLGFAISGGNSSAEQLLKAADHAMYEAKRRQRGSYAIRIID